MESKQTPANAKRRNSLLVLLLLLVFAAGIGYWSWSGQDTGATNQLTENEAAAAESASTVVKTPFEGLKLEGERLIIENPQSAKSFTLPSGTELHIPAAAFVDANGETVQSPVRIQYREFRDAAEIIASGIPMRVHQDDGSEEWMQTAGMFEVRAYVDDKEVQLAAGKKVDINFISPVDGEYDFWNFDEQAGNWDKIGTSSNPEPVAAASAEAAAEVERLRQLTQAPPESPQAEEGNMLGFTDLDVSHIPELKGQKPLMLAYVGKEEQKAPKNNPWVHKAAWFKKKIQPTKTPGVYELTLLGDSLYNIKVKQALTGAALERANARYAKQKEAYEANLAALRNKEAMLAQQRAFRRTMGLENTGIYNYDILWKQPDAVPLMADFDFEELPAAAKQYVTVYLITGEGRVVVGLPQYDWSKLRVNPEADNKMLAVLPGNKVALFPQSAFEAQKEQIKAASGKEYRFDMDVEKRDVNSLDDLRDMLKQASS